VERGETGGRAWAATRTTIIKKRGEVTPGRSELRSKKGKRGKLRSGQKKNRRSENENIGAKGGGDTDGLNALGVEGEKAIKLWDETHK